jgi:hypothetical protein
MAGSLFDPLAGDYDAARPSYPAARELARVLRPGGYWAAWWNQEAGDGEEWFDAYQAELEPACAGYVRPRRREAAAGWADEPVARTGRFEPVEQTVVR